jgi:predicted DNA-binding transcriptional regulator YafY
LAAGASISRSIRLTRIQHLLYANPRGLTSTELARLCGVCIRTIQRDLVSMESELKIPLTQEGDHYSILEGYILPPISLSLFEAMAIFLASRLCLRQTDENNPHVQLALTKIARALPSPLAEQVKKSADYIGSKVSNPNFTHIFEQVAIAWSTQRKMLIRYQSLQSQETKEWVVCPYFVDMTGVGYSTYVIGHARHEDREGITTFKLDRMREAELLEDSFETPDGLSLERLLGSSWGVMWGEETEVKLKFSPRVARRVKESVWHSSQTVEDLPGDGCVLTVRVGSVLEMTPWIRGWGPDVEVLVPKSLRDEFRIWASKLAEIYGNAAGKINDSSGL